MCDHIRSFSYDLFKNVSDSDFSLNFYTQDPGNVGVGERFAAGGMAGATTQATIYPLEILKTRIAVSPKGTYNGILDCWRSIVKSEGFAAMYKGD